MSPTCANEAGGKFAIGVNDNSSKFAACVNFIISKQPMLQVLYLLYSSLCCLNVSVLQLTVQGKKAVELLSVPLKITFLKSNKYDSKV